MRQPWRLEAGQKSVGAGAGSGSTAIGRAADVQTPELGASYSGCPGSVMMQDSPRAHGVPFGFPRVAVVEQRAPSAAPPPVAAPPVQAVGEVHALPSANAAQNGVPWRKQAISVQPPSTPFCTLQVLQPSLKRTQPVGMAPLSCAATPEAAMARSTQRGTILVSRGGARALTSGRTLLASSAL
jgi:hypothetical protein